MAVNDPNNYIPKDYEDLYRYYVMGDGHGNSLTHRLVRKFLPHATDDERETLAQDVLVRAIEKDMLKVFDPTKANFGGVIFFLCRTICVNHLARKGRNPITGLKGGSLVEKDPETEVFEPGVYSLDRLFASEDPNLEGKMETSAIVEELFTICKELFTNPRHKRDQSLYPLLQLLFTQHDVKECGEKLNVTPSTIHNWLGILKEMVTEIKTYMGKEEKETKPSRQTHLRNIPFVDV